MPTFHTLEDAHRDVKSTSPLTNVMFSEFRESILLTLATFKDRAGSSFDEYKRETELPDPQRRQVNGVFTNSRGTNTMGTEAVRIYGSSWAIDRFLAQSGNFDPVAEVAAHSKATRLLIESEMIYGDPTDETPGNIGQIQGFQYLAENSEGNEAETSISAGSDANGTALSLRLFQRAITNALPAATMIVCGEDMVPIITSGSRDTTVSGQINYIETSYGHNVPTFNGLPIVALKRDHTNAKILPFNEPDVPVANSTTGSIYIVSHNVNEGGWYPFMTGPPFVEEDSGTSHPLKERNLEWYIGVSRPQPTAVIRIRNIKDAGMTV